MRRLVLALAVLLLAPGCARPSQAGLGPAMDMLGAWELVEGTVDGAAIPAPEGARAPLVVEEGQLGGRSFCNSYSSGFASAGGRLSLDGLGGTEMACEPTSMQAERAYLEALARADGTPRRDGAALVLSGEGVELRFTRQEPAPVQQLVGPRWVLESLVQGDVASSTGGEPALLRFAEDGTVSGSTGCRALTGTWTANGDEIAFPNMSMDGECPQELVAQDDHVVRVLGDGFQARVDGAQLTVLDSDGWGLVYGVERP